MAVECKDYEAKEGSRECEFFLSNGSCSLPSHFMCSEWEKAQAKKAARAAQQLTAPEAPKPASTSRSLPVVKPPPPPEPPKIEVPAVFSKEAIDAFKAQKVEVDFAYGEGAEQLWTLVGSYSGKDRQEISIDDAAIISTLVAAFPGSKVVKLTRKKPEPKKDP